MGLKKAEKSRLGPGNSVEEDTLYDWRAGDSSWKR